MADYNLDFYKIRKYEDQSGPHRHELHAPEHGIFDRHYSEHAHGSHRQYLETEQEPDENFSLSKILAKLNAKQSEEKTDTQPAEPAKIASSSPSLPPADPSAPTKAASETPTEKPAVNPSTIQEDPKDPKLQDKAKALAKEMKDFVKSELGDGDLERFVQYCSDFGKSYINKVEFKARLWQWKQNDKYIKKVSWDERRHYKIAHNKFSDWSKHEYESLLGYAQPAEKKAKNIARMPETNDDTSVADSVDWSQLGFVSDVVD